MTKAMVLAAGVGSRLDPISQHIPKPLVPVLNKPVIEHVLDCLKLHGIEDVVANTHYLSELLCSYFNSNPVEGIKLNWVYEPELSGDAGGVRACRKFLGDESFLVVMGDLFTNADLSAVLAAHKAAKALVTIGVKKVEDVSRFGVMLRDKSGFIKAFQEKPKPEEAISNEISTGIYVLEPEVFDYIPASGIYGFGRQLFPKLVEAGLPVLGHEIEGHWSDIGTLQDLFNANMEALRGKFQILNPRKSEHGLVAGCAQSSRVFLGKNVSLGPGSKIGENCIIGDDCRIESSVSLENALVFPGSEIESGRNLNSCIFAFGDQIPMQTGALKGVR